MDPAADLLEAWINQDKKTMTSRALARELGIAVNEAQTVLEAYAMSHLELHPTYLVTGRLLTSFSTNNGASSTADSMDIINGDEPGPSEKPVLRQGIQLCTRKDLQAKRALFSPEGLRQTIYSLAPATLRDPSSLVECARTLRTHRMYHNPSLYGTAVCPSINAPPPPDIAPAKVKGSVNVAKPGSNPGGSNGKATAVAAPAKAAAGEEKKASAWDWTKKKPKEKEEERKPSLKRKASPPPPPPRAKSATTVKRAVISSDEESEQPPKPAVKASAGKPTKAQIEQETEDLKGLWDDDDNVVVAAPTKKKAPLKRAVLSSSDDDVAPRAGSPKPPSKTKAKASSAAAKGKAKDGDAASKVVSASGRVRKLRRVVRTETRTNKRGYMETIDISGEESYSSDASSTSDSKPKPATSKTKAAASSKPAPAKKAAPAFKPTPAPAKKKVGGGGGVGYQPSVASFFSKK